MKNTSSAARFGQTLYLIALLLWLIVVSACQGEKVRYRIGVSQCSDDSWRQKMNDEILREAMLYDGVSVEIRKVKDDNDDQIRDVRYFISQGIDLLVISANQAAPMTPVVEEAFDAGIPVVLVDRKILSEKYTAYIGADNRAIGQAVGQYIAGRLGGSGQIIELTGLSGSTPASERHEGFMAAICRYPDLHVVAQADVAWEAEPAEAAMDSLLTLYPQIDAVFAYNDRVARGVRRSELKAGRDLFCVGIDALPGPGGGLEMVLADELDATFIYPTGGDKVMQLAMNILEGRAFPRETLMRTAVVDATNARVMELQTSQIDELDQKINTLNGRVSVYLDRFSTQRYVLTSSLITLLLVIGLLLLVYQSLRTKTRQSRELARQKQTLEEQKQTLEDQTQRLEQQRDQLIALSQQLEEATHAKLVFFTNISHDFRTPLTLVADPVNQLLADPTLPSAHRHLLELVQRNTGILLRLVNQILDFRKYENGKMEFTPTQVDVLPLIRDWSEAFSPTARRKHIRFAFHPEPDTDYHASVDVEKLERICFNLLSNAFKFTPEGGRVGMRLSVQLMDNHPMLQLTVTNTGSLISPEHVQAIFERFYQIDRHHAGSGIGLALVKAFVDLHGGQIQVSSNPQTGTTFEVWLPVYHEPATISTRGEDVSSAVASAAVPPSDFVTASAVSPSAETTSAIPSSTAPSSTASTSTIPSSAVASSIDGIDPFLSAYVPVDEVNQEDPSRPTLLIIDDNADIRTYVKGILQPEFTVVEAGDGSEGLRLAMRHVPDLIISDVMMPGMDGIECCRRLKNELQTCHIPVMLLTACSLDEQRIQGYDGGADSYISKPFSRQLLLSRVRNLIAGRRRLLQFFGDAGSLAQEDVSPLDRDFVTRFKALLEERMGDSDVNVDALGREMGLSRVQLYRKLKSLTGRSPVELLRTARLRRATTLLTSTELTVAEVAYEVGFTTPSYFTKCFREEFGHSPAEARKRLLQ